MSATPTVTPTAGATASVPEAAELPVVVVGAGPVGLAAAAHLLEYGLEPLVLEAGEQVGAAVAAWGQIRLFSHGNTTSPSPRHGCWSPPVGSTRS